MPMAPWRRKGPPPEPRGPFEDGLILVVFTAICGAIVVTCVVMAWAVIRWVLRT